MGYFVILVTIIVYRKLWNLSWTISALEYYSRTICYDIGDRFINPIDHPRTWGVTLFMGLFLRKKEDDTLQENI